MFSKNLKYIFLIHFFTSFRLVLFILSKKRTTMSSTATRIPPLLEGCNVSFLLSSFRIFSVSSAIVFLASGRAFILQWIHEGVVEVCRRSWYRFEEEFVINPCCWVVQLDFRGKNGKCHRSQSEHYIHEVLGQDPTSRVVSCFRRISKRGLNSWLNTKFEIQFLASCTTRPITCWEN